MMTLCHGSTDTYKHMLLYPKQLYITLGEVLAGCIYPASTLHIEKGHIITQSYKTEQNQIYVHQLVYHGSNEGGGPLSTCGEL